MSAQRSFDAWDRPPDAPRGRSSFEEKRPPAPRTAKKRPSGLWIAFVASLVLHTLTVGTAIVYQLVKAANEPPPEPTIELVDASQFPNLKLPKLDAGPAAAVPDQPKNDPDAKQIVALAKPDHPENAPADAKFLAEDNHSADHQTVARDVAVAPKVLADQYKGLGDHDQPDASSPTQGTSDAKGESNGDAARTENATKGDLDAQPKPLEHLTSDPFGIRARPILARDDAGSPGNGADHDAHTLAAGEGTKVAMAGAPNNDYLPGIAVADRTNLAAKEFVFASFWHRFQDQVDPIWARKVNENVPTVPIAKKDYLTRVDVTLSESGAVLEVDVTRSCGVDGWDRAVVDAIKEAAPFMNPPKGLIEPDGRIHMGDLGFIVSLTGGNIVHMYGDPRAGKLFPGMGEGLPPGTR